MSKVTRERMLATLATLLMVYVESHRRIPDLERDLEDGAVKAICALIENRPKVDEDWLIAKANAVLYALRRRFRSRITAADTAMMRDLLADVVMAAGVKVKEG